MGPRHSGARAAAARRHLGDRPSHTHYAVRVPLDLITDAIQAGVKTTTISSGGAVMDIQKNLGADWLFGGWRADAQRWCHLLCELFANTAGSAAAAP